MPEISTRVKATLCQLLVTYGIPTCVDVDTIRRLNEITLGKVPLVLDESVDIEVPFEDNVLVTDVLSLLEFEYDLISALLDTTIVIPMDLIQYPTVMPWEILGTIGVYYDKKEVKYVEKTSFPVLILLDDHILYVKGKNRDVIPYHDLIYLLDFGLWANAKYVLDPGRYAYVYKEDIINTIDDLIQKHNYLNLKGLSDLFNRPYHHIRIDIEILERVKQSSIRDRIEDWFYPYDNTKVTTRKGVKSDIIDVIAEESSISKKYTYKVYDAIKTESKSVSQISKETGIPEGAVAASLSLFTRFNILLFTFKYKAPIL